MELVFCRTRNNILQKYIEGYYFISEDKNSNIIRYKTFPNNYSILSVSGTQVEAFFMLEK